MQEELTGGSGRRSAAWRCPGIDHQLCPSYLSVRIMPLDIEVGILQPKKVGQLIMEMRKNNTNKRATLDALNVLEQVIF